MAYRMATVTLWQKDDPGSVHGYWHVFLRYGANEFVTLARGDISAVVPTDTSPREWLGELLEGLSRQTTQ